MEQIETRFSAIEKRIMAAAKKAQRDYNKITLLAASKKQPISKMLAFQECMNRRGLAATFGENYIQEFREKSRELLPPYSAHLIGALQSNKAKDAVKLFDVIETVHTVAIAQVIEREAHKLGKVQQVFLEVNVSYDEAKSGFSPAEVIALIGQTFPALKHVALRGLMTMTRLYVNKEEVRADYRALRDLARAVEGHPKCRAVIGELPLELSMGISDDFEIAIEEGATIIRIGTALFGER